MLPEGEEVVKDDMAESKFLIESAFHGTKFCFSGK
jgi:hypothetical protein